MRSMSTPTNTKRYSTSGFTLIEIMIIAPVVILVIGGFIALIISLVGDTLVSRDRNALNYDTQNALDTIERDVRLSTQFLTTSKPLPSPQGSDSGYAGTAAFTSSSSLILSSLGTTDNPLDSTRLLVYYAMQPNPCGSKTENRLFLTKIIYFVNNGSLWRRSIVPTYNTNFTPDDYTVCATPWQQNSCSPGYVAAMCKASDVELLSGVQTFSVKYFSAPGSLTDIGPSGALAASTIEVTINSKRTVAGDDITTVRSLRSTKLNDIDAELPIPNAPSVTAKLDSPNRVSAQWNPVPGATSYTITYTVNGAGGGTSTQAGTTFTLPTDYYRKDTVSFSVTATNVAGTSASPGVAAVTIPDWTPCALENGWVNYETTPGGHAAAAFTLTSAKLVVLKGLIKNGPTTGNTICTLPVGYRPATWLIFQANTATGLGRVDIGPDGRVFYQGGSNAWFNLSAVYFYPASTYTWTTTTPQSGWAQYGGIFAPIQVTKDSIGRAYVQGVANRNGASYADGVYAFLMPTTYQTEFYNHFVSESGPGAYSLMGMDSSRNVITKGQPMDYWAIQTMYYPAAFTTGWSNLSMSAGWSAYTTPPFSPPQYRKAADGVVSLRGLLKKSSSTVFLETIGVLPVGYRPKEIIIFATPTCCGSGRIDILPNGVIQKTDGLDSSVWQSFDGMNFMAEQ